MDITQELQALSMEMSIEPHPIPNPLPSTTPPTPPSNSQTLSYSTASRNILKPTVLIQRPLPERPLLNNKNSPNAANAFLPREFAEVVAIRQRRERTWYERLMICITIHSCIESTLSNFSIEIEKEEAETFKAYIQLAIAKFAAVDSFPSPQIPTHTRPTKGDGIGKDVGTGKKVAIVLPQKPVGVVLNRGEVEETPSLPFIHKITENA
ncbi:putative eka-like protein [Erysiphe necator]|uniref:Putative eka-like protein n=1 Tax=Uncinula necator TaxID=52586 RepID=A0A0B1P978_UNCNE|nr:putative eka-like protein [Erysiphe necator]